jgi:hypothetical protein
VWRIDCTGAGNLLGGLPRLIPLLSRRHCDGGVLLGDEVMVVVR